jgi:peptidoglycan-associated lipoprotein
MRVSSSLKLALAFFSVVLITGCHSTSTKGSGDDSATATAPAAMSKPATDTRAANSNVSQNTDGSWLVRSSGNIVYFDFDQDTIRPDAREVLMVHAANLVKSGEKVVLEGNADERGTREYNMALGERRAKAVRDFLVLQGVNRAKIEVVSYGEERPADTGHNELAWAKNRRVEIKNK